MRLLFINNPQVACGVHQYGKRVGEILAKDSRYEFKYAETDSFAELFEYLSRYDPSHLMINYHEGPMHWLKEGMIKKSIKSIGIYHEPALPKIRFNALLDNSGSSNKHANMHPLPRPIAETAWGSLELNNRVPAFGSFGFPAKYKGIHYLIDRIAASYDEAILNLNLPVGFFGGENNQLIESIQAKSSDSLIVNINTEFLSDYNLALFLRANDVNVFLYDHEWGRGNSSCIDHIVSAEAVFAINDSYMFRHVERVAPEVNWDRNFIADIIREGNKPAKRLKSLWTNDDVRNSVYNVMSGL